MLNLIASKPFYNMANPLFSSIKADLGSRLPSRGTILIEAGDGLQWKFAREGKLLEGIAPTGNPDEVYRVIVHTNDGVKPKPVKQIKGTVLRGIAPSNKQIAALEKSINTYIEEMPQIPVDNTLSWPVGLRVHELEPLF
jgi:hypothetical protein